MHARGLRVLADLHVLDDHAGARIGDGELARVLVGDDQARAVLLTLKPRGPSAPIEMVSSSVIVPRSTTPTPAPSLVT